MRHWRLFIYLTFLSVLFIFVINDIVEAKFVWQGLKQNKSNLKEKQNGEENEVNEVFNDLNNLCNKLLGKKVALKKSKFFTNFIISKIIKNLQKNQKEEIKECCEQIDTNNLETIQNCNNIIEKIGNKNEENPIYQQEFKKVLNENNNNKKRKRRTKRTIFPKKVETIKKYLRKAIKLNLELKGLKKIINNSTDTKNTNLTRVKRGTMREIGKSILITSLLVIGGFSAVIAISSLISLLTPAALFTLVGVTFFGGITYLCVYFIKKLINKNPKNNKKRKRIYSSQKHSNSNEEEEEENDYVNETIRREVHNKKGRLFTVSVKHYQRNGYEYKHGEH